MGIKAMGSSSQSQPLPFPRTKKTTQVDEVWLICEKMLLSPAHLPIPASRSIDRLESLDCVNHLRDASLIVVIGFCIQWSHIPI